MILVELAAVDSLEHEQPLGHVRPDHLRHDEVVVVLEVLADQLGVAGLLDEVELGAQVHLELVLERPQLQQLAPSPSASRRNSTVERTSARSRSTSSTIPGRRTLTTTSRPSDSSAAWIWAIEAAASGSGSSSHHRVADVLADDPLDLLEGERRHLVHELRELLDVDVRQQVRARREQLAELEEGRAELLQRLAELDRALARRGPAAGDAELAQHTHELAPPRDADDFAGAARALHPGGHPKLFPRCRRGSKR